MTETINGLHSCKPGNDPVVGQVQLFVIEHRKGKSGKPYIKIKRANEENGGTPHRILAAEPTGFTDNYGNISFNIEVEASSSPPSAFQQTKAAIQEPFGVSPPGTIDAPSSAFTPDSDWPEAPVNAPQTPSARSNGGDGVTEARKHLMQSANLYNLCVAAVDKAIAPWMPEVARTSEQFQAAVASLYIEASKEQWWSGKIVKPSLIDSMPTTPIKNGDQ